MAGEPKGVDLKDRWREVANVYSDRLIKNVGNNYKYYTIVLLLLRRSCCRWIWLIKPTK